MLIGLIVSVGAQYVPPVPTSDPIRSQANAGPYGEVHTKFEFITRDVTSTEAVTVTSTHNIVVTSTSDIWQEYVHSIVAPVTVYTTERQFLPEAPDTVTKYIQVTQTPVEIRTVKAPLDLVHTVTTEYTSFYTSTTDLEFWTTIEHVFTNYDVYTEAVFSTQVLEQVLTRTATEFITSQVTVTRTPLYY